MRGDEKARLHEHIKRVVDTAPPVSADARSRLAVLLRPTSVNGGRAA